MPLDGAGIRRACRDTEIIEGRQFCRAELERFRKAAASGEPITVACTQEAPLFSEIANEIGDGTPVTFVNIRETAGWSKDAAKAGPKMAALIAAERRTGGGRSVCVAGERRRRSALRQG